MACEPIDFESDLIREVGTSPESGGCQADTAVGRA